MSRTVSCSMSLALVLLSSSLALGGTQGSALVTYAPESWAPAQDRGHAIDREVVWQGQPSLKMWLTGTETGGEFEGRRWHLPVAVKAGQVYTICAQVRSKLEEGAVGFEVAFYASFEHARKAAFTPNAKYRELLTESSDWAFIAWTFAVPQDKDYASVSCRGKSFIGQVWFSAVHLFEGESLPVPIAQTPPQIDGEVKAGEWQAALTCRQFVPLEMVVDESVHEKTAYHIAFDEQNLYLSARCPEPHVDNLTAKDGIDLFVSPSQEYYASYYHFAFRATGKHAAHAIGRSGWTAQGVAAEVSVGQSQYTIEARIPLAAIPEAPAKGAWKLALQRRRAAGGREEASSWSRSTLEVRRPWIWTPVHPCKEAPSLAVRFDRWHRESTAFRTIKNYGLFATQPLHKELLSAQPRRHLGKSGFIWRFAFSPIAEQIALRFGMAHDSEVLMRDCKDAGLAVYEYYLGTLDNSQYATKEKPQRALDRSGAKVSYYAACHQTTFRNRLSDSPGCPTKQDRGRQLIFDPEVEAYALADLKRTIESNRGRLRSVMLGDEVFVIQLQIWPAFLRAWHGEEILYPWLDKAMAELKEKYGYGEFGPPLGPNRDDEDEPFRRIAFKRWFADHTVRVIKNFHDQARKLDPNLLVIGPDVSFHRFARHYAYSRYEPYLDVLSGQLLNFWMKVVGDLVGDTDLWPCNHREGWGTSNETIAYFSENILHGAAGFNIWPRGGVAFRGKSILHNSMYWSHRPRWDTHLRVTSRLKSMPRLSYPRPDAAILFSNITDDTNRSYTYVDNALYELLGPRSGAWFRYVSDYQIEDRKVDLARFKAVFIPQAKYDLECVPQAMRAYVKQGGRLVICDPEVFTFLPNGERHDGFRGDVAGVTLKGTNKAVRKDFRITITEDGEKWFDYKGGTVLDLPDFPVDQAVFSITCRKGVKVLAEYPDGTPAITLSRHGKGECIYFAFQPCMKPVFENRKWVLLFRELARSLGVATNHRVWQFQLPLVADDRKEEKALDCLTGNHLAFYMHEVIGLGSNVEPEGMAYKYSEPPDVMPDSGLGEDEWIPFAKGDLTDRAANLNPPPAPKRKKRQTVDEWVVAYGKGKAFSITFDLAKACLVQAVNIAYQGHMPKLNALGSVDGKAWQELGVAEAAATEYVAAKQIPLKAARVRYVKLDAAETEGDLTLSEVEIWGKAADGMSRRSFAVERPEAREFVAPRRVVYPESVRDVPAEKLIYLIGLEPKNDPQPGWLPPGKKWVGMNGKVALMSNPGHKVGITYDESLYAQARTEIVYDLPEGCTTFVAAAGLGNNDPRSSVVFRVLVDGEERYKSDVYGCGQPVLPVVVDVKGTKELRLITDDGGDGIYYDYAWWGEARLVRD